jgi:hypothetical protein
MSSNKDLKDIIQDHFDSVEVGVNEAWRNDMSASLDAFNKRKRRCIIFFFLIASVLLFSSITFAMYFFSGQSEISNHAAYKTCRGAAILHNTSSENPLKSSGQNSKSDSVSSNEGTVSNEKQTSEITNQFSLDRKVNKYQNQDSKLGQQGTPSSKNTDFSASDIADNDARSDTRNDNDTRDESDESDAMVTDNDATGSSNNILPNASDSSELASAPNDRLPNVAISITDANIGADADSLNSRISTDPKNTSETATIAQVVNEMDSLQLNANNLNPTDSTETLLLAHTDSTKFREDLKKTPSLWEIGVLGGASYDVRTFNVANTSPYLDERTNNEQMNWGWSASIEVARKFGNYQLITGLAYRNISETIDYNVVAFETSEEIEIYTDNSYWDYDSVFQQGVWYYFDSVYIDDIDTNIQTITTSIIDSSGRMANGRNSFQYIQIPLRFGFPIYHLPKLKIDGFVGGSVGILAKKRGDYLLDGGGITAAEAKKVTLNSYFAIRMKYEIMDNMSIGAEPYMRFDHGNHSSIEGVKRRYTSFGLNVGLFFPL